MGGLDVGKLLGEGSDEAIAEDVRQESAHAAKWLWEFAAPGYGPLGSCKLVAGASLVVASSPASALREVGPVHPALAPYLRLVETTQATQGDGATTALLLAAATVRRTLDAGGALPPLLDGLQAAKRQVLATLAAHARPADPAKLLVGVVPDRPAWPAIVLDGLHRLEEHGRVDLDALDVRAEPVEDLGWDEGLVLEPQVPLGPLCRPAQRVALVHGVRKTTVTEARLHIRTPGVQQQDRWTSTADHVAGLGIGLLLSSTALPESLRGLLLDRGVMVQEHLPKSLAWRVVRATGAEAVPTPELLTSKELGVADLERRDPRRGGWWLHGPGVAATLRVPHGPGSVQEARVDDVERLLRAAGAAVEDPRGVPGAGHWQRSAEASLRAMAPHLEGRAQLGAAAVADALRDLRAALVRNAGLDPLDVEAPPAPEGLLDGYRVVQGAVEAALVTATSVLRLDGRFRKRSSAPADLRGGTGPAGSPLGMPGDIPPLM